MKMREQIAHLVLENAELERSNEKLAAEVTRLNGIIMDKTIPALISATNAMVTGQEILRMVEENHHGRTWRDRRDHPDA